jgi:hypothetical protein
MKNAQAVRAQTLLSIQAAENVMSSADEKMHGRGARRGQQPEVGEEEIASLVGQLEKYAENKTRRGKAGPGFGGSNNVNKPSSLKLRGC